MPIAPLMIVPMASAAFAYVTMLFVSSASARDDVARARARRQARWTAVGAAAATFVAGLMILWQQG
jgi:hypothetical protein